MLKKATFLILVLLLVDQLSKIWIKTHLRLGEEIYVFDWFRIHFIENNGAAWGMEIGGKGGKLFLTLFRLVAIVGIGYWLVQSIQKKSHKLFVFCLSLIFAGALGNLLDSLFYGLIFDHSNHQLATLFAEEPYGSLFHGKVVDLFYFPIWSGVLPSWMPFVGGENFTFFNAIFNVADSAISVGVALLVMFGKKVFPKES